jgi:hypothetical protein
LTTPTHGWSHAVSARAPAVEKPARYSRVVSAGLFGRSNCTNTRVALDSGSAHRLSTNGTARDHYPFKPGGKRESSTSPRLGPANRGRISERARRAGPNVRWGNRTRHLAASDGANIAPVVRAHALPVWTRGPARMRAHQEFHPGADLGAPIPSRIGVHPFGTWVQELSLSRIGVVLVWAAPISLRAARQSTLLRSTASR